MNKASTDRCGSCVYCEIERIGCACDGAYDPDGCFRCNPEKHARPACLPGESVTHKYQVVLERRATYVAYVEVEDVNFERAKQRALGLANSSAWVTSQVTTTAKTITMVPKELKSGPA